MYQFTSESVSEGHPDKVADLISDHIATWLINHNINNRAAIETLVTTNTVIVAGEYRTDREEDVEESVRGIIIDTVKQLGYEQEGFHWDKLNIEYYLHGQSSDIALGTDSFGAGDQGIMFGYANRETKEYMPFAISYAHKILQELSNRRKTHSKYKNIILPDSKCQLTVNYGAPNTPIDINNIVVSTQHHADATQQQVEDLVREVVKDVIPKDFLTEKTKYQINPTGRFVIGGPDGDTGITGRKIVVDTYGGYAPHGGGAFSGKDFTKVDRSAAYMARWLAKNIVHKYELEECFVQLSYVIGIEQPSSLLIYTNGELRLDFINMIKKEVDLTPKGIINALELENVILPDTTNYGHFGDSNTGNSLITWEDFTL